MIDGTSIQEAWMDLIKTGDATHLHGSFQLAIEDWQLQLVSKGKRKGRGAQAFLLTLNISLHTFSAIIQSIQHATSHANISGSKTQCLEHIGPPHDPTIHKHLHRIKHLRTAPLQLQKHQHRRWSGIKAL